MNKAKFNTSTVKRWVMDILGNRKDELEELPATISEERVEQLIQKSVGEYSDEREKSEVSELQSTSEVTEKSEDAKEADILEPTEKCSYRMKRNIMESLQEIRRFAEEQHLAATMIKALLTLLAEMAINALKGKVGSAALAVLLNAMNYEQDKRKAFEDGEIAGRNMKIETELFSEKEEPIPCLHGSRRMSDTSENIFKLAEDA